MTLADFRHIFPSSDACLEYLKARFYPDQSLCPRCRRATKFHRIRDRSAYACQFCGTQVYPTAGTILHKSSTSLQLWFWAIFLIGSTRGDISVRQLERELGVTYKTAHRMLTLIEGQLAEAEERKPGGRERTVPSEVIVPSEPAAPPSRAWHGARRRA